MWARKAAVVVLLLHGLTAPQLANDARMKTAESERESTRRGGICIPTGRMPSCRLRFQLRPAMGARRSQRGPGVLPRKHARHPVIVLDEGI